VQKIYLKPAVSEITIKGTSKEGHTDVFAYDYYDDDNRRKLGGLYIVGNVKEDGATSAENAPDIAYVTNLVASLAKREYYSKPDLSPRNAFSATLKKVNDVIEEFFKNKSLKVNIGIFAVAGEYIMISKLGKFKIILGRDSRIVDILNNIDLFNKEQVEEKEFSNIVSGKVMAGDKLFAFCPNRMITARERTIKADLLKADPGQFVEKINSVKKTRPGFDCGALYLSLDEHKEPAVDKSKTAAPENPPSVRLGRDGDASVNLAKMNLKELQPTVKEKDDAPDNKLETPESAPEIPKIISSEFSLSRKSNPLLSSIMAPINMVRGLYDRNINMKRKFVILSLVAGVLVFGVALIKMFVVVDPEQRKLNTTIDQTRNDLKSARTKISRNDLIGARQLLAGSLSSIYAVGITNDKTQKTANEIYEVLDDIDKAVDVSPTLLELMPEELNKTIAILNANKDLGIALGIYEDNLYILTQDNILKLSDIDRGGQKEPVIWLKSSLPAGRAGDLPPQPTMLAVDGNIYVMNGSGTLSVYYKGEKISDTNTFIISNNGDVLLTSKDSSKLYIVNKTLARIYELDKESRSLVRTLKVGSSEPFVDAYLYGDSTIIITAMDGRVWEIK